MVEIYTQLRSRRYECTLHNACQDARDGFRSILRLAKEACMFQPLTRRNLRWSAFVSSMQGQQHQGEVSMLI